MTFDELGEWSRQQSKAVQALIDEAHRNRSRDAAARAVDLAWLYHTKFTGPVMMPTGKKAEREWSGMAGHAQRMLVDAACTLAYGRAQSDWQ